MIEFLPLCWLINELGDALVLESEHGSLISTVWEDYNGDFILESYPRPSIASRENYMSESSLVMIMD